MKPENIPDEIICQEFYDRGLWEDDDLLNMFPIDTIIAKLEEKGYTVCKQSE